MLINYFSYCTEFFLTQIQLNFIQELLEGFVDIDYTVLSNFDSVLFEVLVSVPGFSGSFSGGFSVGFRCWFQLLVSTNC